MREESAPFRPASKRAAKSSRERSARFARTAGAAGPCVRGGPYACGDEAPGSQSPSTPQLTGPIVRRAG